MKQAISCLIACLILSSCVTVEVPVEEYSLARAAQNAALNSDASKYAPQYFHKAQKLYKRGEYLFKERYYEKARKHFVLSRRYAERAESIARVKQFQTGDMHGF